MGSTGVHEVQVPGGATHGMVVLTASDAVRADLVAADGTVIDELGPPSPGGSIRPRAAAPFGFDTGVPATVRITAEGDWSLGITPVPAASALHLTRDPWNLAHESREGSGDDLRRYVDDAPRWGITHRGTAAITVTVHPVDGGEPVTVLADRGEVSTVVTPPPAPGVVVIRADGDWTIEPVHEAP